MLSRVHPAFQGLGSWAWDEPPGITRDQNGIIRARNERRDLGPNTIDLGCCTKVTEIRCHPVIRGRWDNIKEKVGQLCQEEENSFDCSPDLRVRRSSLYPWQS